MGGLRGGLRKGAGRKPEDDPRIPLPFRLKTSAVEKAKRLGRDRVEQMIQRAKENAITVKESPLETIIRKDLTKTI